MRGLGPLGQDGVVQLTGENEEQGLRDLET